MAETLAHGYSSESTQLELSNEYQHDRVWIIIKNLCVRALWMKLALALEGLNWLVLLAKPCSLDVKSLSVIMNCVQWVEVERVAFISL